MRRVFLILAVAGFMAAGCATTYDPYRRAPERPRYERGSDPVVGHTRNGRRVYEDRHGRLYTYNRRGQRVYVERGVYRDRRVIQRTHRHYEGCEHDKRYRKHKKRNDRGRKRGHRKHDD